MTIFKAIACKSYRLCQSNKFKCFYIFETDLQILMKIIITIIIIMIIILVYYLDLLTYCSVRFLRSVVYQQFTRLL